jgi:hypothetical protein
VFFAVMHLQLGLRSKLASSLAERGASCPCNARTQHMVGGAVP